MELPVAPIRMGSNPSWVCRHNGNQGDSSYFFFLTFLQLGSHGKNIRGREEKKEGEGRGGEGGGGRLVRPDSAGMLSFFLFFLVGSVEILSWKW